MNHPLAAYGKALMKQGNEGSALNPVEPTNRHRSAMRQARCILKSYREQIRPLWQQRNVKRRPAEKLAWSNFRSGGALWGSR